MLKLLTEPAFVRGKRGIHAARLLAAARKEIESNFHPGGAGELDEETWQSLCTLLDTVEFTTGGQPGRHGQPGQPGVSVLTSVLPFMEALVGATAAATAGIGDAQVTDAKLRDSCSVVGRSAGTAVGMASARDAAMGMDSTDNVMHVA